jgi:O-antigen/teichoic acid export membrane protein
MTVRVFALALWVWLLTQQLPAEDFGWLASVLAVSAIFALIAPLGIPYLFFTDTQSSTGSEDRWCEALGSLLVVGPALAVVGALLLDTWMNGTVSLAMVITFMVVEVFIVSLVQSAGLWGHSVGRLGIAAGLPSVLMVARAVAAGLCVMQVGNEYSVLETYLLVHIVIGALTACAVLAWVTQTAALKWRPVWPAMATCMAAWRYAAMSGAALASSELDKPLVVRVIGLGPAGHYAMAYRVCSVLAMPSTALAASMLPRWIAAVAQHDVVRLKRSFLSVLLLVAIIGSVLMVLLYGWLMICAPGSFGLYPEAWPWMQGLACLGVVLGLRQVAATALIAIGRPLMRALLDMVSLVILAVVAFLGYPALGSGAVILACISAEVCAALAMAVVFFLALGELGSIGNSSDA